MNEDLPEDSAPSLELSLRAKGREEAQWLIAVTSLGMCQALAAGVLLPEQACRRLFGPALLTRLEQMEASPSLRHALHLATELEDVAHLVPEKLAGAIAEVEAELRKALGTLAAASPEAEKWLVRAP